MQLRETIVSCARRRRSDAPRTPGPKFVNATNCNSPGNPETFQTVSSPPLAPACMALTVVRNGDSTFGSRCATRKDGRVSWVPPASRTSLIPCEAEVDQVRPIAGRSATAQQALDIEESTTGRSRPRLTSSTVPNAGTNTPSVPTRNRSALPSPSTSAVPCTKRRGKSYNCAPVEAFSTTVCHCPSPVSLKRLSTISRARSPVTSTTGCGPNCGHFLRSSMFCSMSRRHRTDNRCASGFFGS